MISTINKRDKIRGVVDAYDRQYRDHYGEAYLAGGKDPYDSFCALKRLNLDTCSEADIQAAIGNPSWTRLECEHCGEDSPSLTTFDGQFSNFSVCAPCLASAASGIETEGHDRAAGRGAEHESPTAESGDAKNIAQNIGGPSQ